MNRITDDQFKKIQLIDKIFGSLSIQQLEEFSQSEQIIARLKGTDDNPQLLLSLIHERDLLVTDVAMLKNAVQSLSDDVRIMTKILAQMHESALDVNYLKSKHGLY